MPPGLILLVQFREREILVTPIPKWGSHDYHMTLIDQRWGSQILLWGLRFLELGFEALGFQGFKVCEFAGFGGQGGCEVQSYRQPRRMTHVSKRPLANISLCNPLAATWSNPRSASVSKLAGRRRRPRKSMT